MDHEVHGSILNLTKEPVRASWLEIFHGGSPETEHTEFSLLAKEMLQVQEIHRRTTDSPYPTRTLHAKMVAGFTDAILLFDETFDPTFAVGHIQPSAKLPAIVRFSNASGIPQPDCVADMRGIALRVTTPTGELHDLLMTNFPVSHARNAHQFVQFAIAAVSGPRDELLARLSACFGASEACRMLDTVRAGMRPSRSLALERYWSRGAVLWNNIPVRYSLLPSPERLLPLDVPTNDRDGLRNELLGRLAQANLQFRLALQPFVDEERTPIEDGAVEWLEAVSPLVEIATLVIPRRPLASSTAVDQMAQVDKLSFNPWNAPPTFRPLGNLNRARGVVYGKSAAVWQNR
jgi:hypothetical protein